MSGICSIHGGDPPVVGCVPCNTDIRDFLPDYDRKLAEAEAAGRYTCECGFVYYRTVDSCPLCNRKAT